jgi:hypothetical protein
LREVRQLARCIRGPRRVSGKRVDGVLVH